MNCEQSRSKITTHLHHPNVHPFTAYKVYEIYRGINNKL